MYQQSAFGKRGNAMWRTGEDQSRPQQKFPQYSEAVLDYFSDLFTSDIRIEDLDNQLRVWVTQFLENSFESKAKQVEVRFIKMGSDGFDVIDNGDGIPESDFLTLAKTLPNREKNDMYKTRSLGHQGEALYSLCKSSEVVIYTRHASSKTGFRLSYDREGELTSKLKTEKSETGTTIEVRKIHAINSRSQCTYKKYIKDHYENAARMMTEYSLCKNDTQLAVTFQQPQTRSEMAKGIKTVKTYWTKPAFSNWKDNIHHILKTQFHKTFPTTAQDLGFFSFTFKTMTIDVYLTKPQREATNRKVYLTRRNFHTFMNKKPAELPVGFKSQFYESYGLWLVADTSIPIVVVHIQTVDLQSFEQRNSFDMRSILFSPQDKTELDILFADNVKSFFAKHVNEFQQAQLQQDESSASKDEDDPYLSKPKKAKKLKRLSQKAADCMLEPCSGDENQDDFNEQENEESKAVKRKAAEIGEKIKESLELSKTTQV